VSDYPSVIGDIKGKTRWVRSADLLAVLTLVFSSLLFFYDLFQGRYLLTERDLGPYFIPPRFFWVESIKHGDFPLWNPYQFSGHPFFANPQHAILYPLNTLFFILPFDLAFNTIIILHFFLGGFFTYLFLKDLKVSSTGSLISGLTFMLSGYLLSVHSLLTCLLSVIWTPLILLFFTRAIARRGLKNEILTAVFMAISFLGGGIEIIYGNFIILLFMVIFSPLTKMDNVGEPPVPARCSASARKRGLPCGGHACVPKHSPAQGISVSWLNKFFRRRAEAATPACRHGGPPLRNRISYWAAAVCRSYIYKFRSLLIVSIGFILLSAIQLFPFLELFIHSIRGQGISYQEATIWSFAPKDVLLFVLPDVYGYFVDMRNYWVNQCWFKTLYTGGLPFVLSLICFFPPFGNRKGRDGFTQGRGLYLSLILLSLFLSLGQYNPLYPLVFKYVPFFNGIRYPVKFLYIFILILSITAGLGFEKWVAFSKVRENKTLKNLLIPFSLASGCFLLFLILGQKEIEPFLKGRGIDFPDFNLVSVNLFHAKRFFFYLALFFLLLRAGYEVKWKGWIRVLFVLFLTTDLFGNMGFYGRETTTEYFRETRILEILSSDQGDFRVFSTSKTISMDTPILVGATNPLGLLKEKHVPSMTLLYRLPNIWGIDVIHLKRVDDLYMALISAPSISATSLIDLYGVKYVISVTPLEKDHGYELLYARIEGLPGKKKDLLEGNTIKLYRKREVHPRAWVVNNFRVLESKEILSMLKGKNFHPGKEVLLEEGPKWKENSPNHPFEGGVQKYKMGGHSGPPLQKIKSVGVPHSGLPEFISETNNRLVLHVKAKGNTLLVLSDTFYPGWKAFVDGKEEKILRANYNFRAVPLSAGTHQVAFVYAPVSFRLGAIITFLTIIGCFGIGWISRRRPQRIT